MWNRPPYVESPAYGCGLAHIFNFPLLWYIKRRKRQFLTQWCKTDIDPTKVFRREDNAKHKVMFMVESPTFVCEIAHLVWNRPPVNE